jgi:protein gp37
MCPDCLGAIEEVRPRVFCMSMGDIFEDRPELIPWRADLIKLIEATPRLDWLVLTKRIELARTFMPPSWPANVWMGTSVENQTFADERIPELMKCPAQVRFLSVEPLLESVSIIYSGMEKPNWVIVGGESGPKYRPFNWDWARSIRDVCLAEQVPFFMKQGGGYPDKRDRLDDLPADLRIREWPR